VSDTAAVHEAEARLQTILKAVVVSAKTQDPASRPGGEDLSAAFASAGALEPPYDPEALCLLTEHSNSLRQNVDAYATNIDGFGHRFDPAIDLEADDADDWIADAIYLERLAARDRGEFPVDAALQASAEEVAESKRELVQLARIERARLESFFDFCCFDHSFVDLRRRTRQDLEVTAVGSGYSGRPRRRLSSAAPDGITALPPAPGSTRPVSGRLRGRLRARCRTLAQGGRRRSGSLSIPDRGQVMQRYYGYYSNRQRGKRRAATRLHTRQPHASSRPGTLSRRSLGAATQP